MLNKFIVQGRLTKEVETKVVANGTMIATVSIAVQRNYSNREGVRESDFFKVSFFGKTAENVQKFFHKGDMILIEGELQLKRYVDQEGNKRSMIAIKGNGFQFCGQASKQKEEPPKEDYPFPVSATLEIGDDDLPF